MESKVVIGATVTVPHASCHKTDSTGNKLVCGDNYGVCQGGQWVQTADDAISDIWKCERVALNDESWKIGQMAEVAEHFTITTFRTADDVEKYDVDIFGDTGGDMYSLRIGNSFRHCRVDQSLKECKDGSTTLIGLESQAFATAMLNPNATPEVSQFVNLGH